MRTLPFSLKEYEEEIESLYEIVFGRKIRECRCKDRLADAIIEMSVYLKKNTMLRSEVQHKLKNGVVITWENNPYTNANLTDEVAVAFLKRFPMASNLFAYIPKAQEVKAQAPAKEIKKRPTKKARKK